MGWRGIAIVSVIVNLLAAAIWLASSKGSTSTRVSLQPTNQESRLVIRTNLMAKRVFGWHEIESDDYPTFIANLRDIGCPEQTIRDIIIADVNVLFAKRRATELLTPQQQWWRSEPDSNVVATAYAKAAAMEQERKDLLATLLGPNWESGDLANIPRPSRAGVVLDGPVLGTLATDTKLAVQNITVRSQDRMQAYIEQMQREGKSPDPQELARLRQQVRYELAGVLSPLQMEEFLLRYSENANALRETFGTLQFFNASAEEFRSVFRSTDSIDQQIAALTGNDPSSVQARRALEQQRENSIKLALGAKRYEEYRLLQDPLYRQAVATAQEAGTPEAARTIYQINVAAALEQARINASTNLTAEQRNIETKQLELDQMKANTIAAGQDLPPEPPPTPTTPPRRTYTVRQGDSLAVVAMIYGVPTAAIVAANPGMNFGRLRPGDTINIPRTALNPPGGP